LASFLERFIDSKAHHSFVPEKQRTKNQISHSALILKDISVSFREMQTHFAAVSTGRRETPVSFVLILNDMSVSFLEFAYSIGAPRCVSNVEIRTSKIVSDKSVFNS